MSFATQKGSRIIITLLIFYRWNIKWWYFIGVARFLVLYIVVSPFSLAILLSVQRFTNSNYPFGIFKLSLIKKIKAQSVMVNTVNKVNITSHLKLLNIKKTMKYVVCNPMQLEIAKKKILTFYWHSYSFSMASVIIFIATPIYTLID